MLPGETILPEYVEQCTSHPKPVVLVYFIGGVTYGQIATLRLLGKILSKVYKYFREVNRSGNNRNNKWGKDDKKSYRVLNLSLI